MLVEGLFVYRAWHYLQYTTTIPCDCDLSFVEVNEQILNIFYTMFMATLNSKHIRIRYLDISMRQAENNGIFGIAQSMEEVYSMEIDAGKLLDRTRVMYHRRIDYNTICKSCTIVVKWRCLCFEEMRYVLRPTKNQNSLLWDSNWGSKDYESEAVTAATVEKLLSFAKIDMITLQ